MGQRMKNKMERILISRTDGVGDLLLATPLIREVRRAFPKSILKVLVSDYAKEVLHHNPDVDGSIVYKGDELGEMRERLLRERFDTVFVVYPRPILGYLFRRTGIPLRIGTAYRWYSPLFFNRRVRLHRRGEGTHEADLNLRLAKDWIGEHRAERLFYHVTDDEIRQGREYLNGKGMGDRFFIVFPGGKGTMPNLDADAYAGFLVDMVKCFGRPVLVASGKGEQPVMERMEKRVGKEDRVHFMKEELSIRELASVIHHGAVFISGSTGPMHIAASLGVRTLTFFPASGCSEKRWGPIGNRSTVIRADKIASKGGNLLDPPSVDKVMAELERLLADS